MSIKNISTIKTIVLVNPPVPVEQVYGSFSEWASVTPPLGLAYIGSYMKSKGYSIILIDALSEQLSQDETVRRILGHNPDIVGFSCLSLWVENAHNVASVLKKSNPGILIVAGGNHVTALPERSLNEYRNFDIIVIGEGEITFYELIKSIEQGKDMASVPGVAFRESGRNIITPERERLKNPDELPQIDWDLLPSLSTHYHTSLVQSKKRPSISILFSRGCPGKCKFCDRSTFGNLVTKNSPEYAFTMVRTLVEKYGIRDFQFADDNLIIQKKFLNRFLDLILESKLKISFTCHSRVDTCSVELFRKMKKAGCWQISLGVESGNQTILDAMNKKITINEIKQAVRCIRKSGLSVFGLFIVGYPGETEATMKDTLTLIKKTRFDDVSCFLFAPLPGAEIYEGIHKAGSYKEDWTKIGSMDQIIFIPNGLTKEILEKYSQLYYNACFSKPWQIKNIITRLISPFHRKALLQLIGSFIFRKQAI